MQIYSRTPNPGPEFIAAQKATLAELGYPVNEIVDTPQASHAAVRSREAAAEAGGAGLPVHGPLGRALHGRPRTRDCPATSARTTWQQAPSSSAPARAAAAPPPLQDCPQMTADAMMARMNAGMEGAKLMPDGTPRAKAMRGYDLGELTPAVPTPGGGAGEQELVGGIAFDKFRNPLESLRNALSLFD